MTHAALYRILQDRRNSSVCQRH